jgi:hypothetical protein
MTLEQKVARLKLVADGLRRIQEFESARYLDEYAAHLAQPAQAVDVGAIREVIDVLNDVVRTAPMSNFSRSRVGNQVDKLTRALSGEKAGPVGDGLPDENWFADQLCDLRNRWGEHEPSWLETDDNHPDDWMAKELRKRLLALPVSPTPGKEGE